MKRCGSLISPILLSFGLICLSQCKSTNSDLRNDSSEKSIIVATPQSIKDGCYALSVPGASSGVICIGGLSEEGINGSGVRVAYGTQTSSPQWCAKSISSGFQDQKFVISFNASTKMKSMSFVGSSEKGTIDIKETDPAGGGTMNYTFVSYLKANEMLSSKVCKASEDGSDDDGDDDVENSVCKTYIESCAGGKRPVKCSDSYYCIEETPGADFPRCVPKNKLVDRGRTCGSTSNCMKCP